jgi:hypothetical protein
VVRSAGAWQDAIGANSPFEGGIVRPTISAGWYSIKILRSFSFEHEAGRAPAWAFFVDMKRVFEGLL